MKRQKTVLTMVFLWAGLLASQTHGQFSAFARITPETEKKHNIQVQILPVRGWESKCRIIPPKVHQGMSTYLIVCRERVPPKEQNFRGYIWYRDRDWDRYQGRYQDRTDILSVAPLLPYGLDQYPNPSYVVSPKPNHVVLDRSLLERSYIYIDYPTEMTDGGYYYCIDLSTYPLPEARTMRVRYSPAQGLGPEKGVMRRDPSDIIKIGTLFYVWYSAVSIADSFSIRKRTVE